MPRPLHTLLGFVGAAAFAFGITRAALPPRTVDAASPHDRVASNTVSFTYRPANRARPIEGPVKRADPRAADMLRFQGSLRSHGDGLSQAWPEIYEALVARLHELAASDDAGVRLRGCFGRTPPAGLRVELDLDSDPGAIQLRPRFRALDGRCQAALDGRHRDRSA